jgi:predicted tellurium resistance membrane protein TerC
MLLIIIGLVLSVPLIVFGSQLLLKVLNRFPVLVTAGGGLLGWIAGEVIATDPALHARIAGYGHNAELAAAVAGAVLVMVVGKLLARRAEAKAKVKLEDLSVENTK